MRPRARGVAPAAPGAGALSGSLVLGALVYAAHRALLVAREAQLEALAYQLRPDDDTPAPLTYDDRLFLRIDDRMGFLAVRVHRSALVNFAAVERTEESSHSGFRLHIRGFPDTIEMSRRHATRVRERLG